MVGNIKGGTALATGRLSSKWASEAVLWSPGTPEAAEVRDNADSARFCRTWQVMIPAVERANSSGQLGKQ